MELVKNDFHNRCADIKHFHEHIAYLSTQKGTVKISSILKSSLFVALYNNVEATFYAIFERIHSELTTIPYLKLNDKLKAKIKDFYFKDKNNTDEECQYLTLPPIYDFLKKINLFSGNLDARKGKAIFKTYGISFEEKYELNKLYSLVTIKNKRNKIAHGELSLPEAGKTASHQSLLQLINNSIEVLDGFIRSAELFLSRKNYLIIC